MPTRRLVLGLGLGALALTLTWGLVGSGARTEGQSSFAADVAALSEPQGYFDTDNLISNERSYLEVVPELKKRGVHGGAYIGVGPDQNFSYIAAIRPEIVYVIDVRRDNLLLHLLFKSLFTLARSRIEYVSMLLGRPVPDNVDGWRDASLDRIVAHVEGSALDERNIAALRQKLDDVIAKTGVPLSRADVATIDRFHRRFIEAGIGLRFQSTGRPPQSHYPTYRDLLLATDALGEHSNYLASEDAYQFIKRLHQKDLVIPVVGDLGGTHALTAIGTQLRQRGLRLSAFYTSNVEFYLFGDGKFDRFVSNVGGLPRAGTGVIIRSVFGRYASYGSGSTSYLQSADDLVAGFAKGKFRYYGDLILAQP